MASSNQGGGGGGSQTEPPPPPPPSATHSSDKNTDPTSPPPPPSATNYPTHPPPGSAYPPPPYPPYYPPYGQNPHAYPQGYAAYTEGYPTGYHNHPPAAPYYGPPPTYSTAGSTVNAGNRFLRSFILCCCITLTFLFLGSVMMALMLRPELPIYMVGSMSVTNFTTTPTLSGEWDIKMSIENPNVKLRAYFSDFRVDVIYKDSVVAMNYARGFALNTKEVKEMEVKGSSTQANESVLEKTRKDDMVKERASGSVTFTLRVASINAFESGSFSTRTTEIVGICEGLKLVFQNNSNTGTLDNGGKPVLFQLYV